MKKPTTNPGARRGKNRSPNHWLTLLFIAILIAWAWSFGFLGDNSQKRLSYTEFRSDVEAGRISQITVEGEKITGEYDAPDSGQSQETGGDAAEESESFVTYLPSFGDDQLLSLLQEHNVEVQTRPSSGSSWWWIIINLLPFLLILGLFFLLFRRGQSQAQGFMQMGKTKAKSYQPTGERTTFDDVAGSKGAKQELKELIEFLRDPQRFHQLGATIPTGVLLVGPPGTGKTLLGRAVAGEANVPFFSLTGSDFMEMFVGVGASRVRDLFQKAAKSAPSIVFVDELDSIGRRRGAGLGGGHDEREQTLNQLLSEMDGFEESHSLVVMGATNRPDILDPALLRPGRFDRRVTVDLPTVRERAAILELHAKNKKVDEDVDFESLARSTHGFSGADLANLLNEGALLAARNHKQAIGNEDLSEARDKVTLGLTRESLVLSDRERSVLAYHEGGHAITAGTLLDGEVLQKVSIIPRGRAMGATHQYPENERYVYQEKELRDKLVVLMAGRAAEKLRFDTISTGAEDDLKKATQLARRMVLNWGMSSKLPNVSFGEEKQQVFLGEEIAHRRKYSEKTAEDIDESAFELLDTAFGQATRILEEHRESLDRLADQLLEEEEVSGDRVLSLLNDQSDNARNERQSA